jgi:hypothetical protein
MPNAPQYRKVPVKISIACRCPETTRMLRNISNSDNRAAGVQLKDDFPTCTFQIHRHINATEDETGVPMTKEELKKMKLDNMNTMGIKKGNMGLMFQIARRNGEIWDCLVQILSGKLPEVVKVKGGRAVKSVQAAPKSSNTFNKMGNIDDDELLPLLQAVCKGDIVLDRFRDECDRLKAQNRIRLSAMQFLEATQDFTLQIDVPVTVQWVRACEEFPCFKGATFLDTWTGAFAKMTAKDNIPSSFHGSIQSHITAMKRKAVNVFLCTNLFNCHDEKCLLTCLQAEDSDAKDSLDMTKLVCGGRQVEVYNSDARNSARFITSRRDFSTCALWWWFGCLFG